LNPSIKKNKNNKIEKKEEEFFQKISAISKKENENGKL
jgi:hypothetical protein